MVVRKTEQGLRALQSRDGTLSSRDRHVLILADGRRSAREIGEALGGDAVQRVERLLAGGYLATSQEHAAGVASQAMVAAEAGAASVEATTAAAPEIPAARLMPARRSLAAARLYLLDMLQFQRGREAAELARALQRTTDPEYQVPALLDALRHILAVSRPSYGDRVAAQLALLMPESDAWRVHALRDERDQAPLSA
ncbi:MAG: hypothetical protein HOQ02_05395 [Lysobacter sp.]|nr:hypothetical protein [Lysobacter sp.]